jgi:hypothetical protein
MKNVARRFRFSVGSLTAESEELEPGTRYTKPYGLFTGHTSSDPFLSDSMAEDLTGI